MHEQGVGNKVMPSRWLRSEIITLTEKANTVSTSGAS